MQVVLFLASNADEEFVKPIEETLKEFNVATKKVVASAHKVPEKVLEIVEELNQETQPTIIITVVGMSNGLGGVVSGSSVHPVINCPPYKDLNEYMVDIHSSLRMPSEVPALTILHPKNAALAAIRILAVSEPALRKKVVARIQKVKGGY